MDKHYEGSNIKKICITFFLTFIVDITLGKILNIGDESQ